MGARATRLSDLKIKAAKPKDKDPPSLNDKARPVRALSHLGLVEWPPISFTFSSLPVAVNVRRCTKGRWGGTDSAHSPIKRNQFGCKTIALV